MHVISSLNHFLAIIKEEPLYITFFILDFKKFTLPQNREVTLSVQIMGGKQSVCFSCLQLISINLIQTVESISLRQITLVILSPSELVKRQLQLLFLRMECFRMRTA
jgi:hypothetical protein